MYVNNFTVFLSFLILPISEYLNNGQMTCRCEHYWPIRTDKISELKPYVLAWIWGSRDNWTSWLPCNGDCYAFLFEILSCFVWSVCRWVILLMIFFYKRKAMLDLTGFYSFLNKRRVGWLSGIGLNDNTNELTTFPDKLCIPYL